MSSATRGQFEGVLNRLWIAFFPPGDTEVGEESRSEGGERKGEGRRRTRSDPSPQTWDFRAEAMTFLPFSGGSCAARWHSLAQSIPSVAGGLPGTLPSCSLVS